MIPVGDVIAQVDTLAQNGLIPGINSAQDLYRDQNHLNNVGRFIATTTFFATLYKTSPVGLPVPAGWYNIDPNFPTDQQITPQLATALQSATWEVVKNHPYTSVPEPAASILLLGIFCCTMLRRR